MNPFRKIKLSDNMKGVLISILIGVLFFATHDTIVEWSGARLIELPWHRHVNEFFADIFGSRDDSSSGVVKPGRRNIPIDDPDQR